MTEKVINRGHTRMILMQSVKTDDTDLMKLIAVNCVQNYSKLRSIGNLFFRDKQRKLVV